MIKKIKKYQAGGSTPRMSPSSVAKGPSKKTGSMHEAIHKAQETVKKAGVPKAPAPGMKTPPKKGGSTFRYQVGGSTMTPKSKSLDPIKNTPPVGSNGFKTGVYKGTKLTPAQIKQSQQDWIKKEKQMTNPKNKPAGSPIRKLQNGGTADSTKYFYDKSMKEQLNSSKILKKEGAYSKNFQEADKAATKSSADYLRQIRKGKPGYDKNGYPKKK